MENTLAFYLYALGMFVPPAAVLVGAVSLLIPRRKTATTHVPVAGVARA